MKVRRVIEILEANGWRQVRRGASSHKQFRNDGNPNVVTIPGEPRLDIAVGTLAQIRRLTGIEELR